MMKRLRRAMVTRSASNSVSASGLSTCLVPDISCFWSSPKPLPAPLPSLSALAQPENASSQNEAFSHDRRHIAPLRHLSLCREGSDRPWPQGPCLGIGRASADHAETESDGADRRLSQDAGPADWRGHLLRQPADHARARASTSQPELLS